MRWTGNNSANWEMGWEMGYFKTIPGKGWEMGRVKMGEHWRTFQNLTELPGPAQVWGKSLAFIADKK